MLLSICKRKQMSSVLFDSGDFQRLDRERTLIEQRERIPAESDRSPDEFIDENLQDENPFDIMLEGLLEALKERL